VINWPVEQPTLSSSELTLRPLREEDIDPIFRACQDPTIPAFTRVPSPYDREMAEEFVRGCDISYRSHQGIVFAMEKSGIFAGTIGLHGIKLSDHCAEVGYWVEKSHRGSGLCTAATKMLLDFTLNVMEFRRIEGMADYNNLASQRVMERAGMVREALLRNRVTKPNGDQIDMVLFSKVKQ
jgi:ribosomal-protein-alanine N-acetyltransferase